MAPPLVFLLKDKRTEQKKKAEKTAREGREVERESRERKCDSGQSGNPIEA